MQIAPLTMAVDDFAQQDGSPVPKLWRELTKLMASIGQRQRLCPRRQGIPGQDRGPRLTVPLLRIQA
jgi:hypothetical protein